MVEKIAELTKEQEETLSEYRDKWLAVGTSVQKTDREKANAAIDRAYVCAGLNPPKIKIWLRSPYEGVIGAWWLKQVLRVMKGRVLDQVRTKIIAEAGERAGDQVGERVRADVLAQLKTQVKPLLGVRAEARVKELIGDPLKDQVRDRLWSHVWNQIKDQVKPQPAEGLWGEVWTRVWDQLWEQAWRQKAQAGAQIGAQAKAEIVAQARTLVRDQIEDLLAVESHCAGLHDANFLGPYDFFSKAFGVDVGMLSGLMVAAEHCGWFWPFDGAAVITEKPSEICRDQKGRIHNEKDLAIRYSDGWGVGVWYGTRVDNWVITHPELITLDKIIDEKNAAVRRVMRERFGVQEFFTAMIKEGLAKKVSRRKDSSGMPMTLYRYDEKEAPLHFVHVYNGEAEPNGQRREFIISCKNVADDALDSMMATYPDLMKELKDNPRKFEIIYAALR